MGTSLIAKEVLGVTAGSGAVGPEGSFLKPQLHPIQQIPQGAGCSFPVVVPAALFAVRPVSYLVAAVSSLLPVARLPALLSAFVPTGPDTPSCRSACTPPKSCTPSPDLPQIAPLRATRRKPARQWCLEGPGRRRRISAQTNVLGLLRWREARQVEGSR